MRILSIIAASSLLISLSACGAPDEYYDSNGNWVGPANSTTQAQRRHAPNPGKPGYYGDDHYRPRTVTYDRAGYYDYNGNYVTMDDTMRMGDDQLPPRGMCRIWLPNRTPQQQPAIEECDGIQNRVPVGAYVVYGG